jgi:hypothetical protein
MSSRWLRSTVCRGRRRYLEPTSPTIPAAAENDHQNDDDDQKRRVVHHCLLFEAHRIGVPPREGEFTCEGSDPAACLRSLGLTMPPSLLPLADEGDRMSQWLDLG